MMIQIVTEATHNTLECPEWWMWPVFGVFVMRFILCMFRAYSLRR